MNDLAPIGVSTYSRLSHFKQTIQALRNNDLAEKSILYIFSDAPQEGDEQAVSEVRSYADTISGFKRVHIIKRKQNNRVQNNRGGIQQLLNDYGNVIFLEEDIVTSKHFLTFMNEALNKYKDKEQIISISGYCPSIKIPKSYEKDVFLLKRFTAWGFATWAHKFNPFSYTIEFNEYKNIINDLEFKLNRYGQDIVGMVQKEANGELDALDVRLTYHQVKNDLYTVYPVESLVENIGHDGSGIHCRDSRRFDVKLSNRKLRATKLANEDKSIVREFRKFRNLEGRYYVRAIFRKLLSMIPNIK